jgi:hypothetical protein
MASGEKRPEAAIRRLASAGRDDDAMAGDLVDGEQDAAGRRAC